MTRKGRRARCTSRPPPSVGPFPNEVKAPRAANLAEYKEPRRFVRRLFATLLALPYIA